MAQPSYAEKDSDDHDDNGDHDGGSDDHGGSDDDSDNNGGAADGDADDQNEAREAAKNGKVQPLREVLKVVAKQYPGDILDVNYRAASGLYRIKLLDRKGRLLTIKVDARSKRIIP